MVFPGGIRESADEDPILTAALKTYEETGKLFTEAINDQLRDPTNKPVMWLPSRKYAMYMQE